MGATSLLMKRALLVLKESVGEKDSFSFFLEITLFSAETGEDSFLLLEDDLERGVEAFFLFCERLFLGASFFSFKEGDAVLLLTTCFTSFPFFKSADLAGTFFTEVKDLEEEIFFLARGLLLVLLEVRGTLCFATTFLTRAMGGIFFFALEAREEVTAAFFKGADFLTIGDFFFLVTELES